MGGMKDVDIYYTELSHNFIIVLFEILQNIKISFPKFVFFHPVFVVFFDCIKTKIKLLIVKTAMVVNCVLVMFCIIVKGIKYTFTLLGLSVSVLLQYLNLFPKHILHMGLHNPN